MTVTSYHRGHQIYYNTNKEEWLYSDNHTSANVDRQCQRCNHNPTKKGHDFCLSNIENKIESACCGHGVSEGYIVLKDGRIFKEVKNL